MDFTGPRRLLLLVGLPILALSIAASWVLLSDDTVDDEPKIQRENDPPPRAESVAVEAPRVEAMSVTPEATSSTPPAAPTTRIGSIAGHVVDLEHHQPIANAHVVARARNGVIVARVDSSGDGAFRLDGLNERQDYVISVDVPGFVLSNSPVWASADSSESLVLSMRAVPVMRGVVRDETGIGVTCRVEARSGSQRFVIETNASGEFEIGDLPGRLGLGRPLPERLATLRIRSSEHRDAYAEITRAQFESGNPLFFDVVRGARIGGRVIGVGGSAISGVEILAYPLDGSANAQLRSVSSGSDGAFAIGGLPGGRIRIEPQHSVGELIPALAVVDIDLPEHGEHLGIELAYIAGLSLGGRVIHLRDESPLSGMLITLHHESWIDPLEVRTDAAGEFLFSPIPEGNYRIALRGRSWRDPREPIVIEARAGQHDLVFRVDEPLRTGSAVVTLHERETGAKVVDSAVASVRLVETSSFDGAIDDTSFVELPIDDQGRVTLDALAVGSFHFEIKVPGYAPEGATFEIPRVGERVDLEISLEAGIEVRGRVIDERGEPIEGARVAAFRDSAFDSTLDPEFAITTDRLGQFTLTDVAPKAANVAAIAPGFAAVRRSLDREPEANGPVELVLSRGSPVRGTVYHRNGSVARDFEIRLSGPIALQVTATDGAGRFAFDAVEAGPFRLLDLDGRTLAFDTSGDPGVDLDIEIRDR